jgi:hypothetical protein
VADFLKPLRLSDFGGREAVDLEASVARLTDELTTAVDQRFPGSAIVVAYLTEQDGVVSLTANGTIGGEPPADDDERREREAEIARIAAPIFDSYDWVVRLE